MLYVNVRIALFRRDVKDLTWMIYEPVGQGITDAQGDIMGELLYNKIRSERRF